ncbi:Hypothetical predicted protein, partial [Paramuricea clavata]
MSNAEYLSDSGSLTPPLADIEKQWQEFGVADDIINIDTEFSPKRQKTGEFDGEKFTPFFNCCHTISKKSGKKQSTTNLRGGYIEPGLLSRLLQNEEPKDNLLEKPIIKLFDYQFITATALVEQRQKLFYFLRQKMFEFESQETDQGLSSYIPQTGDNCWFYTSIRKQCCSFLLYVSAFVHRNLSPLTILAETNDPYLESWNSFPASLRKDVNNLWLFIGAVSSLPNGSFLKLDGASSNIKLSPAGQWLHLHLELKWGLTEILWRLYCVQDEKCVDQLTEIEEKLSALLKDLLHTATHINNGSIPSTLLHTTPFLCPCVKELWVIMIHFLDFLSDSHDIKSFWSALTTILNELLQGDKDQIKNFSFDVSEVCCKDPMLFCWWLLVHIAPLYWYNVEGEYVFKEKGNVSGNGILVQDLLRLAFLSRDAPKVQEDLSRCYLSCCLHILQHWHPNNDVVLLLWDYFHKKMNEMFYLQNQRIQTVACSRDTPAYKWFEQVLDRCNDPLICNDNETSYELFLRIVALHLKKLKNTKSLQGWKQLKGRFYSKFHKKRMEELSEQGILSFFNLFLTLACVGELEDVTNKMLSFLELLDFKLLDYGKKICIWKGYFVLLFLYKSQKTNAELIAQKVSTNFTDICRNYKEMHKDKCQRQNLWGLISVYLESTQELLEYKCDQRLGDYKLIGEGFDILVPLCGDRELQILLSFTQAMMIIISNELQDESRSSSELAQSLWDHVFPHIRQRITDPAVTQAHLNQLTNLAVGFTLLSITVPPESSPQTLETFHNLIRDFGLKDSMTASVSCKFLATLLASPEALEIIQSNDCQTEIVHTWFRCSLQKSSQDQHLLNLTRIVFLKIPETGNIIKTQRSVVAGNVEAALVALIRSLGESFSSLKLLADTVVFREKALVLIGDFLKYIESFLKQGGPPDCLRLSYKVAASLVRDCAKIIYKKTQHDCLLPKIIDQLVLPLNTKKPRSPAITQCIKLNLAEFLEGLASLDFRRDEFIKRKIKQIFAAYFHVFNQKCYLSTNSSPIKNPFLDVLKGTLSANPTQDSSGFRQYVINIIKYNYLVIPGRSPQELIPTLFFLGDLFKRTLSPGETARNTPLILKNILACLLACDTSSPDTEPPYIRSE